MEYPLLQIYLKQGNRACRKRYAAWTPGKILSCKFFNDVYNLLKINKISG
jgi:hypothetical protein